MGFQPQQRWGASPLILSPLLAQTLRERLVGVGWHSAPLPPPCPGQPESLLPVQRARPGPCLLGEHSHWRCKGSALREFYTQSSVGRSWG